MELVASGIRNEQSSRVGRGINEAVTIVRAPRYRQNCFHLPGLSHSTFAKNTLRRSFKLRTYQYAKGVDT